jgi:hypothetical protein
VAAVGLITPGGGRAAWVWAAASVRYSVDTIVMSQMPERCRVTDTGKAACHGFRGLGGGKGWRDNRLRGPVIEWCRRATG